MSNIKNYFAIASALLLVTTILVASPLSLAAAQQPLNTTGANQPNINVEQKISEIRSQFPLLSQDSSVSDVIHKVQGLDKDNALKTLAAFHILRNLQEYQALETGGTNSTG
jgi:hypothetical protein